MGYVKKDCHTCHGSGNVGNCQICYGSGRGMSPDGTYETSCSSCGGTGKRTCYTCNGSGQVDEYVNDSGSSGGSSSGGSSRTYRGTNEYDAVNSAIGDAVKQAQRGDLDGAIDSYMAIIGYCEPRSRYGGSIKGQMQLAYFNMGVAYFKKSDWDNAIENLIKGIGASSVASGLKEYLTIGNAYFNKGDYNRAIEYYTKSINSSEDYVDAYNNRGNCYSKKGNKEQAIADYKKSADWGSVKGGGDMALRNLKSEGIDYTPQTPPEVIQQRKERAERQAQQEHEEKRNRTISFFSPFSIVERGSGEGSTFILGIFFGAIGLALGSAIGGWIAAIIAGIVGYVIGSQVIGESVHVKLGKLILYIILLSVLVYGGLFLFAGIKTGGLSSLFNRTEKTRSEQTATTTPAVTATVTADSANFRSGPSTSSGIIKTLKKGDTVSVEGDPRDGWVMIKYGGETGYVSADLISIGTGNSGTGTQTASGGQAATATTSQPAATQQPQPTDFSLFIGTWKRNNYGNTLTFTANTLKSSSQDYTWDFVSVSGNTYRIRSDYNSGIGLSFRLDNGNIVISGDSGGDEDNWNGTWIKQ